MDVLLGKTLEELQSVALSVGLQKFTGKQLAEWLYVRRVCSFDEMTNISLKGREALKASYVIGRHSPVREAVSTDGTRKYLFVFRRKVVGLDVLGIDLDALDNDQDVGILFKHRLAGLFGDLFPVVRIV